MMVIQEDTHFQIMKNYWYQQISSYIGITYPLMEKNILSIGFSDKLTKDFISEMKKGDYVLVPCWGTFSIYEITEDKVLTTDDIDVKNFRDWNGNPVVRENDGFLYVDNGKKEFVDLGFFRKVRPVIKDVSKYDYGDRELLMRLRCRDNALKINDLGKNIERVILAYKRKKPLNRKPLIKNKSIEYTLGVIDGGFSSRRLEDVIRDYFGRKHRI